VEYVTVIPNVSTKLAGVKSLRIHDLRHFAASTLTGAGVEDNVIKAADGA
jgi:hypothetical protein